MTGDPLLHALARAVSVLLTRAIAEDAAYRASYGEPHPAPPRELSDALEGLSLALGERPATVEDDT